ncbi:MAG: hypothetical protein ABH823_03115, partial [bacterium]
MPLAIFGGISVFKLSGAAIVAAITLPALALSALGLGIVIVAAQQISKLWNTPHPSPLPQGARELEEGTIGLGNLEQVLNVQDLKLQINSEAGTFTYQLQLGGKEFVLQVREGEEGLFQQFDGQKYRISGAGKLEINGDAYAIKAGAVKFVDGQLNLAGVYLEKAGEVYHLDQSGDLFSLTAMDVRLSVLDGKFSAVENQQKKLLIQWQGALKEFAAKVNEQVEISHGKGLISGKLDYQGKDIASYSEILKKAIAQVGANVEKLTKLKEAGDYENIHEYLSLQEKIVQEIKTGADDITERFQGLGVVFGELLSSYKELDGLAFEVNGGKKLSYFNLAAVTKAFSQYLSGINELERRKIIVGAESGQLISAIRETGRELFCRIDYESFMRNNVKENTGLLGRALFAGVWLSRDLNSRADEAGIFSRIAAQVNPLNFLDSSYSYLENKGNNVTWSDYAAAAGLFIAGEAGAVMKVLLPEMILGEIMGVTAKENVTNIGQLLGKDETTIAKWGNFSEKAAFVAGISSGGKLDVSKLKDWAIFGTKAGAFSGADLAIEKVAGSAAKIIGGGEATKAQVQEVLFLTTIWLGGKAVKALVENKTIFNKIAEYRESKNKNGGNQQWTNAAKPGETSTGFTKEQPKKFYESLTKKTNSENNLKFSKSEIGKQPSAAENVDNIGGKNMKMAEKTVTLSTAKLAGTNSSPNSLFSKVKSSPPIAVVKKVFSNLWQKLGDSWETIKGFSKEISDRVSGRLARSFPKNMLFVRAMEARYVKLFMEGKTGLTKPSAKYTHIGSLDSVLNSNTPLKIAGRFWITKDKTGIALRTDVDTIIIFESKGSDIRFSQMPAGQYGHIAGNVTKGGALEWELRNRRVQQVEAQGNKVVGIRSFDAKGVEYKWNFTSKPDGTYKINSLTVVKPGDRLIDLTNNSGRVLPTKKMTVSVVAVNTDAAGSDSKKPPVKRAVGVGLAALAAGLSARSNAVEPLANQTAGNSGLVTSPSSKEDRTAALSIVAQGSVPGAGEAVASPSPLMGEGGVRGNNNAVPQSMVKEINVVAQFIEPANRSENISSTTVEPRKTGFIRSLWDKVKAVFTMPLAIFGGISVLKLSGAAITAAITLPALALGAIGLGVGIMAVQQISKWWSEKKQVEVEKQKVGQTFRFAETGTGQEAIDLSGYHQQLADTKESFMQLQSKDVAGKVEQLGGLLDQLGTLSSKLSVYGGTNLSGALPTISAERKVELSSQLAEIQGLLTTAESKLTTESYSESAALIRQAQTKITEMTEAVTGIETMTGKVTQAVDSLTKVIAIEEKIFASADSEKLLAMRGKMVISEGAGQYYPAEKQQLGDLTKEVVDGLKGLYAVGIIDKIGYGELIGAWAINTAMAANAVPEAKFKEDFKTFYKNFSESGVVWVEDETSRLGAFDLFQPAWMVAKDPDYQIYYDMISSARNSAATLLNVAGNVIGYPMEWTEKSTGKSVEE